MKYLLIRNKLDKIFLWKAFLLSFFPLFWILLKLASFSFSILHFLLWCWPFLYPFLTKGFINTFKWRKEDYIHLYSFWRVSNVWFHMVRLIGGIEKMPLPSIILRLIHYYQYSGYFIFLVDSTFHLYSLQNHVCVIQNHVFVIEWIWRWLFTKVREKRKRNSKGPHEGARIHFKFYKFKSCNNI